VPEMKKFMNIVFKIGKTQFLVAVLIAIFSISTYGQVNATLNTSKNISKQKDTSCARKIVSEPSVGIVESENEVLSDSLQQVEKNSSDNGVIELKVENAEISKMKPQTVTSSKVNNIQNKSIIDKPVEAKQKPDDAVLPENEKNTVPKQ
jgi:hypothetical protein